MCIKSNTFPDKCIQLNATDKTAIREFLQTSRSDHYTTVFNTGLIKSKKIGQNQTEKGGIKNLTWIKKIGVDLHQLPSLEKRLTL